MDQFCHVFCCERATTTTPAAAAATLTLATGKHQRFESGSNCIKFVKVYYVYCCYMMLHGYFSETT